MVVIVEIVQEKKNEKKKEGGGKKDGEKNKKVGFAKAQHHPKSLCRLVANSSNPIVNPSQTGHLCSKTPFATQSSVQPFEANLSLAFSRCPLCPHAHTHTRTRYSLSYIDRSKNAAVDRNTDTRPRILHFVLLLRRLPNTTR